MRSYELVFIVHPEVDGDDLTAVIDRVKDLVQRDGGKVMHIEPWGLRRLAYPIQEQWEGQYVLMRLELEPQGVAALEHGIGLTEQVIRHLIVRVEEDAKAAKPAESDVATELAGDVEAAQSAAELRETRGWEGARSP
ncbi:MAG: 30S ribosomal protein S6 [Anaerolineae bacterium]